MDVANVVLTIILFVFCGYFFLNELIQISSNGIEYLKSFWNYVDLLPPILIVIVLIMHLKHG